jgi:hypothetical protein
MSDVLTSAPTGPQTDVLGPQTDLPTPQTNTIPEDDTPPAEKRSADVKKAIDDALGSEDEEKPRQKPGPKPKAPDAVKPVKPVAPKDPALDAEDGEDGAGVTSELDAKPKPRPTAYREPPAGFDDAAKGEWEAVPETVRGAMHRRAQEMEQGIQKYRSDAQAYEPLRQYADMAKQSGTTIDQALGRYVGMEQKLRSDPMGGLQEIVANLGLKKADGTAVTLRDVAASIMGQTPDRVASQQEATIVRLSQQLQEVTQKIGGFSQHIEAQQHQAKVGQAESEWTSFQRENPRAVELEHHIADFLTKYPAPDNMPVRERLADAYAFAVSKAPSVAHTDAQPLVQTQTPASPNPAGQKSISGAPGGNDAKTVSRNLNRSAAVEKAMRAAGL